jgi:hypothetical protein
MATFNVLPNDQVRRLGSEKNYTTGRTGTVVMINNEQANVYWTKDRNGNELKPSLRTWVKLEDLQLISERPVDRIAIQIMVKGGAGSWDALEPTFHIVAQGTAPRMANFLANAVDGAVRMVYLPESFTEISREIVGRLSGHYFQPQSIKIV